jgi:uncharacterized membrane protein
MVKLTSFFVSVAAALGVSDAAVLSPALVFPLLLLLLPQADRIAAAASSVTDSFVIVFVIICGTTP